MIITQQNKMKALIARKGQRSPRVSYSKLISCCIAFSNTEFVYYINKYYIYFNCEFCFSPQY